MRPLERSLEKLDDVRKKKLSEMIGGSGSGVTSGTNSGIMIFVISRSTSFGRLFFSDVLYLIVFYLVMAWQLLFRVQAVVCPVWRWVCFFLYTVQAPSLCLSFLLRERVV